VLLSLRAVHSLSALSAVDRKPSDARYSSPRAATILGHHSRARGSRDIVSVMPIGWTDARPRRPAAWLAVLCIVALASGSLPLARSMAFAATVRSARPASIGRAESGTPGPDAITAFGAAATAVAGSKLATLNAPIVGITSTPDGGGYWLVAADGGVFTFGTPGSLVRWAT
jgi:hypothetical protein